MPRRSERGPLSRYFAGSQVCQRWAGSTTWSSTLTIFGSSACICSPFLTARQMSLQPDEIPRPCHLRRGRLFGMTGEAQSLSRSLYDEGLAAFRRGDTEASRTLNEQSLAAAVDEAERARATVGLTRVAFREAAYDEGLRLSAKADALAESAGDEELRTLALHMQAEITRAQGHYADAVHLYEELLRRDLEAGDDESLSMEHYNLGSVLLQADDLVSAEQHLRESLRLVGDAGHNQLPYTLLGLGGLAARRGDAVLAGTILGAVSAHFDKIGEVLDPAEGVELATHVAAAQSVDAAAYETAYAAGRALTIEEAADRAR